MLKPGPPAGPLLTPAHAEPPAAPPPAAPWTVWQPVTAPTSYTCTRCGTTATGDRFLELTGVEPRLWPVLPRSPAALQTLTRRVGRQVLCPGCRWARPTVPERPKRRKTTLD